MANDYSHISDDQMREHIQNHAERVGTELHPDGTLTTDGRRVPAINKRLHVYDIRGVSRLEAEIPNEKGHVTKMSTPVKFLDGESMGRKGREGTHYAGESADGHGREALDRLMESEATERRPLIDDRDILHVIDYSKPDGASSVNRFNLRTSQFEKPWEDPKPDPWDD